MSKKAAAMSSSFDPNTEYRVKFRKTHPIDERRTYQPMHTYYIHGDVLNELPADKLLSTEAMPPMVESNG